MSHTFYDSFTEKGKWWMPGTEKKIDGILTVKDGDEIRLELFDSFDHEPAFQGRPVIHGQIDSGVNVTLLDNIWATGNHGSAGHNRITYLSNLSVFGVLADGRDDVSFEDLRLRYTDLEAWAFTHDFQVHHEGDKTTVTHSLPEQVSVRIPDPAISVTLDSELSRNESFCGEMTLTPSRAIVVKPDAPLSLEDTLRLASDFQKFFALLMGKRTFIHAIHGRVIAEEIGRDNQKTGKETATQCDVLFSQIEQQESKPDFRLLFPLPTLTDRFPQYLLNWFASLPQLRPVYEVFFSVYRASRIFLQSHFLHLSQAVESYHRRTVGGLYLTEDAYQPIKSAVMAAIPAGMDEGLRARLKSQIRYANEPSLRTRLNKIMGTLSDEEKAIICEHPSEFVGAVVDTRNYLTHLDESSGDDVLEDEQLIDASRKLELLMMLLLLKHVGIPSDEILNRLKHTARFDLTPFVLERGEGGGTSSASSR